MPVRNWPVWRYTINCSNVSQFAIGVSGYKVPYTINISVNYPRVPNYD